MQSWLRENVFQLTTNLHMIQQMTVKKYTEQCWTIYTDIDTIKKLWTVRHLGLPVIAMFQTLLSYFIGLFENPAEVGILKWRNITIWQFNKFNAWAATAWEIWNLVFIQIPTMWQRNPNRPPTSQKSHCLELFRASGTESILALHVCCRKMLEHERRRAFLFHSSCINMLNQT